MFHIKYCKKCRKAFDQATNLDICPKCREKHRGLREWFSQTKKSETRV